MLSAALRAGASAVDVTPRQLPVIQNGGFLEATADRVVDPLHARCLVLDEGDVRLALVIVDSCMMPAEFCDQVKAQASTATQIPADRILIAATHTHTAPSVMDYCLGSRADASYAAYLPGRIVAAIVQANERLEPAEIGWSVVDAGEFTNCRRWITRPDKMLADPFGAMTVRANMHPGHQSPNFTGPTGPTDPWLTVLHVRRTDGRPLALLANFSMHYFSGHAGISADYYGRYAGLVQQRLAADDPHFVAMMSQGTSGDLWWGDYSRAQAENPRDIDGFAQGLVERTLAATNSIVYQSEVPLAMLERRFTLARRVPDAARLAWAHEVMRRMGDRRPQNQAEVYAEQAVYLHAHPDCDVVLQAIRIGDCGIAALPNEVYGLTGLKLKLQSPLTTMMNIELANGASGYIPPPEQHQLGGYNTWPARTAGLEVQAEPKMVEALLEMLEQLTGCPRNGVSEPAGAYARWTLQQQPLAYYRLAELSGDVARDASGQQHDAPLRGAFCFYLPGPASSAFAGDVINRAVHCVGGRLELPVALPPEWTAELWCWNGLVPDARATTGTIVSLGPWALTVTGSGAAQPGRLEAGGQIGSRSLDRYRWYHVAVIARGQRLEVYLDGERELEGKLPEIGSPAPPLVVGAAADNRANWEGRLDEVAIYPRALSAEEIRQHYGLTQSVR
jgi:hypothetical protein